MPSAYSIEQRHREKRNALVCAETDLKYAEAALRDAESQLTKCRERVKTLQKQRKTNE
jgi:F0F1-type ATP synthase membrane subunit b/b'